MSADLGMERWELYLDDKEQILKFWEEKVKLNSHDLNELLDGLEA